MCLIRGVKNDNDVMSWDTVLTNWNYPAVCGTGGDSLIRLEGLRPFQAQ